MTQKMPQPDESGVNDRGIGAHTAKLDAAAIKDRLADIREKVDKQKIPLSKEVEDYTRANLRKVQEKLQKGEPVYPSDMEFIGKVEMWMDLPQVWREKYKSIEDMEGVEESREAQKRQITPKKQWLALLHMARLRAQKGKEKEWIDQVFRFSGGGEVQVHGNLFFDGRTELTSLPDNLKIGKDFDLGHCYGLTSLPDYLGVGGALNLSHCTGLTTLPDNLEVGGDLDLTLCTGLTSLPDGLKVGADLRLVLCTGLTSLPNHLYVGGDLYLSKNVRENVKSDASQLKEKRQIKGQIIYD